MPLSSEEAPPSLDDVVQVRYGDIVDLDQRLAASQTALREAQSDVAQLLVALGITLPDDAEISPALAVQGYILPKVKALMATEGMVKSAELELRDRANRLHLPEIDLGGGRKAVQVGRRLPRGFLKGRG